MAKKIHTTSQFLSSHTLAKQCFKLSKSSFSSTWTVNFQMFKLNLEKAEEPEINCQHQSGNQKNKRIPESLSVD